MRIKKHIPNVITCLNLLCGCIGIVFALQEGGNLIYASYLIGIAAVFDFLDGFAARLLNVHSEIGKQLDSLADMVTFGVLPGFIMFQLISSAVESSKVDFFYLQYTALLIPIFSAIRLAKFNIDTRQTDSFIGLPTPANSIFIASLPLIILQNFTKLSEGTLGVNHTTQQVSSLHQSIFNLVLQPYFLVVITLLLSFLLIAELPLFALKFNSAKWKGNEIRYTFIGLSVLIFLLLGFVAMPFIIVIYILLSLVQSNFFKTA